MNIRTLYNDIKDDFNKNMKDKFDFSNPEKKKIILDYFASSLASLNDKEYSVGQGVSLYVSTLRNGVYDFVFSGNIFGAFALALYIYMILVDISDLHITAKNDVAYTIKGRQKRVLKLIKYEDVEPVVYWVFKRAIAGQEIEEVEIEKIMIFYKMFFTGLYEEINGEREYGIHFEYDKTDHRILWKENFGLTDEDIEYIIKQRGNNDHFDPLAFIIANLEKLNASFISLLGLQDGIVKNQDKSMVIGLMNEDGKLLKFSYRIAAKLQTNPVGVGKRAKFLSIVSRLMMTKFFTLQQLGLGDYASFVKQKILSQALNLIIGETNSGKSTTILSVLNEIYQMLRGEIEIITFEDPIEKATNFLSQFGKATVTQGGNELMKFDEVDFEKLFLRYDPDAVLVGEIRDKGTVGLGLKAARSGHITFGTMHVNNTLNVIPRITGWGLSFADVSGALGYVQATKLYPTIKIDYNDYKKSEKNISSEHKYETILKEFNNIYDKYGVFRIRHFEQLFFPKYKYFLAAFFKHPKLNEYLLKKFKEGKKRGEWNQQVVINKEFMEGMYKVLDEIYETDKELIKGLLIDFNLIELDTDKKFLTLLRTMLEKAGKEGYIDAKNIDEIHKKIMEIPYVEDGADNIKKYFTIMVISSIRYIDKVEYKLFNYLHGKVAINNYVHYKYYGDDTYIVSYKEMYDKYYFFLPTYLGNYYVDGIDMKKKEVIMGLIKFLRNDKYRKLENYKKYFVKVDKIINSVNILKEDRQFIYSFFVKLYIEKIRKKELIELGVSDNEISSILKKEMEIIKKFVLDRFLERTDRDFFVPFTFNGFLKKITDLFVSVNGKVSGVQPIVEFFDYNALGGLIYKWKDNPMEVRDWVLYKSKVFTPLFLYGIFTTNNLLGKGKVIDIIEILELVNMDYGFE